MFPVRASAALPLFSHIFYLNNQPYLDGGIACPIPIAPSIHDGNQKHIIILTRNPTFIRKPGSNLPLIRRIYKKYPEFIKTEENRYLIDRRQRKACAALLEGRSGVYPPAKTAASIKFDACRRKVPAYPVCNGI